MKKKLSDKELVKLLPAFPCGKLREFLKSPKDVRTFAEKIAEAKNHIGEGNEKVCKWEYKPALYNFITTCNDHFSNFADFNTVYTDFNFCPYCGLEIKWREGK